MDSMTPEERAAFAAEGGKAGGKARAEKLTPEQRSEIARKAASKRWGKKAGIAVIAVSLWFAAWKWL